MPNYSISEFETIKKFLDDYDIHYIYDNYYNDDGTIKGHCMSINCNIETDELNSDDIDFNENGDNEFEPGRVYWDEFTANP